LRSSRCSWRSSQLLDQYSTGVVRAPDATDQRGRPARLFLAFADLSDKCGAGGSTAEIHVLKPRTLMSSIIRARSALTGRWEGWEVIGGSSLELKVAGPSMLGIGCPDRHALLFTRSPSLPRMHRPRCRLLRRSAARRRKGSFVLLTRRWWARTAG